MKRMPLSFEVGLLFVAVVISGCFGLVREPTDSESIALGLDGEIRSTIEPAYRSPDIVVHIDPKTGQIIRPPAGTQAPQSLETVKPPLPELYQELSPVPGGGVMIRLDERFQIPFTGTIDANGNLSLNHESSTAVTNEKK